MGILIQRNFKSTLKLLIAATGITFSSIVATTKRTSSFKPYQRLYPLVVKLKDIFKHLHYRDHHISYTAVQLKTILSQLPTVSCKTMDFSLCKILVIFSIFFSQKIKKSSLNCSWRRAVLHKRTVLGAKLKKEFPREDQLWLINAYILWLWELGLNFICLFCFSQSRTNDLLILDGTKLLIDAFLTHNVIKELHIFRNPKQCWSYWRLNSFPEPCVSRLFTRHS